MLKVLFRTGRRSIQRVLVKHGLAPRPISLTQIYRHCSETSVVLKPEQSLPVETDSKDSEDTDENRRRFNHLAIFDLCLEKLDDDLLYFPEVLTNDEWTALVDHGFLVEEYMKIMKYDEVLKTGKINDNIKENLAKLDVFKMHVPKEYGGLGYMETQAQYIHEILALRPSVARMVAENEEMGIKVLVKYGTEAQKAKYLPKLASGEMTIAFAFLEESSSTLNPNSYLGLEVIQNGDKFVLNGEKCWVYNAKAADAFIVIGTQTVMDPEGLLKMTSLFIIDKDKNSMIVYNPMEKVWFRGVEISKVVFDDCVISTDCVLGQYGKGYDIFLDIFKNNKTSVLAECTSIAKRLVFDASVKTDHLKVFTGKLNFDYGDYGLGQLSVLSYAMESVAYYLASRADYFENPELSAEIALAKIFATEILPEAIQTYFSFVGRFSYEKNAVLEEIVQNSHHYSMLDDSIFDLKIYIMSKAIKHLAMHNRTKITQIKKPFTYPLQAAKFLIAKDKNESDRAKPRLNIHEAVSAGASLMANELEYCIHRLAYCSEKHIIKHMRYTLDHDYDLLILCDMLANIYALIACIARASRANQLQTKNYDTDLVLTYAFALRTSMKVKNLSSFIGRNQEELEASAEVGRKTMTNKNYIAEHPLMRNF